MRDAGGTFTSIDAPGAGAYTVVSGIDESGKAVGGFVDRKGRFHGFVRDQSELTVIDVPGAVATFAARVNTRGQIVGASSADDPNLPALELTQGFLLDNGVFTTIDAPGGASTNATDIDDSGRIVGVSATALAPAGSCATPRASSHQSSGGEGCRLGRRKR